VLLAGSAGAGIVAADLRHGTDERSLGVRMAVMMVGVMVAMVMRVIVAAAARVIDGGFKGFARQFEGFRRNGFCGLHLGIG
jgi:hypothetical protein